LKTSLEERRILELNELKKENGQNPEIPLFQNSSSDTSVKTISSVVFVGKKIFSEVVDNLITLFCTLRKDLEKAELFDDVLSISKKIRDLNNILEKSLEEWEIVPEDLKSFINKNPKLIPERFNAKGSTGFVEQDSNQIKLKEIASIVIQKAVGTLHYLREVTFGDSDKLEDFERAIDKLQKVHDFSKSTKSEEIKNIPVASNIDQEHKNGIAQEKNTTTIKRAFSQHRMIFRPNSLQENFQPSKNLSASSQKNPQQSLNMPPCKEINMNESLNAQTIINISKSLDKNLDLVTPTRKFLRQGDLIIKEKQKAFLCHIFLFNDLILITREKYEQGNLEVLYSINLADARIINVADSEKTKNHFEISAGASCFSFFCDSFSEKESWFKDIKLQKNQLQIQQMKGSEVRRSNSLSMASTVYIEKSEIQKISTKKIYEKIDAETIKELNEDKSPQWKPITSSSAPNLRSSQTDLLNQIEKNIDEIFDFVHNVSLEGMNEDLNS